MKREITIRVTHLWWILLVIVVVAVVFVVIKTDVFKGQVSSIICIFNKTNVKAYMASCEKVEHSKLLERSVDYIGKPIELFGKVSNINKDYNGNIKNYVVTVLKNSNDKENDYRIVYIFHH